MEIACRKPYLPFVIRINDMDPRASSGLNSAVQPPSRLAGRKRIESFACMNMWRYLSPKTGVIIYQRDAE